jgi:hypothetical protein
MRLTRDSVALILASIAVFAVVVLGFYATRGPSTQRLLRSDRKRVAMINQLAGEIRMQFTNAHLQLPASLTDVQKMKYKDSLTGQPLEYSVISPTRYSICVTFARPTQGDEQQKLEFAFWTHPAGHKCFEFDTNAPAPPIPYTYYGDF